MDKLTSSEFDCGCVAWKNERGQMHRLDGPACDNAKCRASFPHSEGYYLNDHVLSKENWEKEIERMKQELHEKIQLQLCKCYAWMFVQHDFWRHPLKPKLIELEGQWIFGFDQEYDEVILNNIRRELQKD